ncbi:MAG: FAD-dependent oxidoreductase [Planctomycetota bacterium]|nr:FAD-dependent oxidoreductase [Planctomycetota bacterium]MDA1211220.1 FAD-dependent oxidoreductase [Planctomycetota bacterium]
MNVDVVIFGGGIAGLWLLNDLVRDGRNAVLIESGKLGQGQTVASQGIIHGGFKYTLQGVWSKSAEAITELPMLWRRSLRGEQIPDLRDAKMRAEHCYLWRTDSWSGKLGMWGARMGLKVAPRTIPRSQRPSPLVHCPGHVAAIDEPVLSPRSLIDTLAAPHRSRIFQVAGGGYDFDLTETGHIRGIHLKHPVTGERFSLCPREVVFTAGAGNAGLRQLAGLESERMQRRPLHMAIFRGPLPRLNGHCVDGASTRVTITSELTTSGETVWQLGGQIAEYGVGLDARELLRHAAEEIAAVLPGIDLAQVQGSTYRVDRAEGLTAGGKRPEGVQVIREGNTLTAWPTKLVLAPRLSSEIRRQLHTSTTHTVPLQNTDAHTDLPDWPRPDVANYPWEEDVTWCHLADLDHSRNVHRRAA